jgi:hypothetical protein
MKIATQISSLFTPLVFALLVSCNSTVEKPATKEVDRKNKKEVLLIGTFHYNNPGADVAKTKTFDVLDEKSQNQLEHIAEKIRTFNPSKVFVEWPYDEQKELDSLYNLYRENRYFTNDGLSDFYLKNEIFQLAFQASKKSNLEKLYAIDYRETEFPFDSVMRIIITNKQSDLQAEIENGIKYFTTEFDNRVENGTSLLELTYFLNTDDMRNKSNRLQAELPLVAGKNEEFIGPYLVSEWHRRNLYMWSLVQKQLEGNDKRIVLLLGASHIAMIKGYIDKNEGFEAVELKEIME